MGTLLNEHQQSQYFIWFSFCKSVEADSDEIRDKLGVSFLEVLGTIDERSSNI